MIDNRDLLCRTKEELRQLAQTFGQPAFRGGQLYAWLHARRAASFDAMSDLPGTFRAQLAAQYTLTALTVVRAQRAADGTAKFLYGLPDGNRIETVAMRYEHGMAVCVSTQVGCRMGCAFCASTKSGLVRSLSAGEILAQLYRTEAETGARADSVVLMGIGEPLDNFDNVVRFIELATDKQGGGIANRGVTLSTCGLVPQIDRLAALRLQLTLSVSLHAATDEKRSAMMPVNRQYPIAAVMAACRRYQTATGRRISFEYAVIHGKNDFDDDARGLAHLIAGMGAHVNLIPVNPIRETDFRASRADAEAFRKKLEALRVNATVRRTLGADISAACGQLRRETQEEKGEEARL
ncbi:MAG: 23S rRNA (adenine(2503)-C(2))-methyltransferase RlmN [Oscillospiraceae bacterium]|nr:23S rRNA (adenine(2503)-C(2))-methyltransferase RlmN [Oscillospiraceae bacterium]